MRITPIVFVALAAFGLAVGAVPAGAQVLATGVTASFPDPNGKGPAFGAVPGAGIQTWSVGLAQGALTNGQPYEYCVSLATGTAAGNAEVSYKLARGSSVIQSGVIVAAKNFKVVNQGIWYWCTGGIVLPSSPGAATLTGTVTYTATGTTKKVISKVAVPVLLQ